MVLLILAAIWAVVLIPPWIRSRRDVRPARSVVSFQRRLSSIERAVPYVDAYSDEMDLDASSGDELGPGVGDDDPAGAGRVDLVWSDDPGDVVSARASEGRAVTQLRPREALAMSAMSPMPVGPSGVAGVAGVVPGSKLGSRVALHRRRQIFFVLLLGVVASLATAAVLNTLVAWAVHGGFGLLFFGYVGLLVRHHHRVMDRALKVRYLTPTRGPRPAVVVLHGTAR